MYLILLSGGYQDIPLFLVEKYEDIHRKYMPQIIFGVILPKPRNPLLCIEAYEPQSPEERDNRVLKNLDSLLSLPISDMGNGREEWNFLQVVEFNSNYCVDSLADWEVLYTFNEKPLLPPPDKGASQQQNYLVVYSDGMLITCCRTFEKARSFVEEYLTKKGFKDFTWDIRGNVAKLKDFEYIIQSMPFLEDSL